ncbi:MAG: glycoside hydrolase family 127 protein [Chloroflexota bacterium]
MAFEPLPLGQVRPAGWLRDQLRIQADGLTGHLPDFWPDVQRSQWIGGNAEGWERGPYWLDGLVPLAVLLDDSKLKAHAAHWVECILASQREDGWLGPVHDTRFGYPYDPWPLFIVMKALTQHHEATADSRIPEAMLRLLRKLDATLAERPLRSWARYRWADLLLSVHWLYERTGESWLLDLGRRVQEQGYDWRAQFKTFPYWDKVHRIERDQSTHVVNVAMALKAYGVWSRQSGSDDDRAMPLRMLELLDRYHGQATGMFSGDEHLAGKNPSQGSELCAVVEAMFSLEALLATLGEPTLADRLERLAYNALPATLTPDMWAHQYDQQVNQVISRASDEHIWTSNGPEANVYGLQPNFPCCTANLHQGWPKLVAHLWMRPADDGLAAIAYGPCAVRTTVHGAAVEIDVETEYPFDGSVRIAVRTDRPVRFPLQLRVPGWADGARLTDPSGAATAPEPGRFAVVEREWQGESHLALELPLAIRAERRFNDSVALHRGPLLLALQVGEQWRQTGGTLPAADWEVLPTTPWAYALDLDPDDPAASLTVERRPLAGGPFSPETAPLLVRARGRQLPGWGLERATAAAPPPQSPIRSDQPLEALTLLPYGATGLRVGELPLLDR